MNLTRAAKIGQAFGELAGSPIDTSNAPTLLRTLVGHCVVLLAVTAADLVVAEGYGNFSATATAATGEEALKGDEQQPPSRTRPSLDAYRSGAFVTLSNIATQADHLPEFQAAALSKGYKAVHVIPMHRGTTAIGVLHLFLGSTGVLSAEDAIIGQALADVATVSLVHGQAAQDSAQANAQLQGALSSRVSIEQAKGIISARNDIEMEEAFKRLRAYARSHEETMQESATNVISRVVVI